LALPKEQQNPEVSILLLDDAQIAPLNRQYLNRSGPTDVISFPLNDQSCSTIQPHILGDVVISVETALRQARRRRTELHDELSALLLHGMLHLLGYDHEGSPGEGKKMRALERAILKKIAAA